MEINEIKKQARIYSNELRQELKDMDVAHPGLSDVRHAFIDGAKWLDDLYEKNRLAACENMSEGEAGREMEFLTSFIELNKRAPTFSDAIEVTRFAMIEKAYKWLYEHLTVNCEEGSCETIEEFKKAMEK